MNDVRLSNSSVTSSAIRLRGAEVSYGWGNLIEDQVVPSRFLTSSDAQSEVQFMGWENPKYSIRGYLDESSDRFTSGINFTQLKAFAKSTGSTYLYEDTFASSGVKISIISFDVQKVAPDRASEVYAYSIRAIETL